MKRFNWILEELSEGCGAVFEISAKSESRVLLKYEETVTGLFVLISSSSFVAVIMGMPGLKSVTLLYGNLHVRKKCRDQHEHRSSQGQPESHLTGRTFATRTGGQYKEIADSPAKVQGCDEKIEPL